MWVNLVVDTAQSRYSVYLFVLTGAPPKLTPMGFTSSVESSGATADPDAR